VGAAFGGEHARGSTVDVVSYDVFVDLTGEGDTFWSRTELDFRCRREGASVFADLRAAGVRRMNLNGEDLPRRHLHGDGRLELPRLGAENTLTVEAEFSYAHEGAGLYRVAGSGDGTACVYSKGIEARAPRIFCCFDQPDLRAPMTVAVRAHAGWCCRANFPAVARPLGDEGGVWRFAPTSPLAPYLFALCAGPGQGTVLAAEIDRGQPVPLTIWAPLASGGLLPAELFLELVRQPVRYYEAVLGVRYPYPKCDLVFVPAYPALAFSAPGLITFQERLLEPSETRPQLYLASVMAHELAHAWVGGLVDMRYDRDMWLQEALATYISRSALSQTQPGSEPWSAATSVSLPDHAYASDAAALWQLEELIGRPAVMSGLASLMNHQAHRTITIDDLTGSWSRTGGRDLRRWAAETLVPATRRGAAG